MKRCESIDSPDLPFAQSVRADRLEMRIWPSSGGVAARVHDSIASSASFSERR
jgi:hypothetical protein